MKPNPEIQEARRLQTISILQVVDYHRLKHRDAYERAITDTERARAACGEQTCEDIMREIERRTQR